MTAFCDRRTLGFALMAVGLAMVLAASVGCDKSWPEVRAGGERQFLDDAPIRNIDILPADVQIWAHEKSKQSEREIGLNFDAHVAGLMPVLLSERGYNVVGNLDWQGRWVNPKGVHLQAHSTEQMVETAWALSSYGPALARSKETGLVPHLPHRLGGATGSDATLYVGGWGYAGKKGTSTGVKVLKTVGIVLVVAVVVVTVAVLLDGKGGKIGSGAGKVAGGAAKAGGQVARSAARVAGGIGRATIAITKASTRVLAEASTGIDITAIHIAPGDPDGFGRRDTHVAWYNGRPDYAADKNTPSKGKSASLIEMTLVDNRRGTVLWHARQRFPASPAKPADVQKMLGEMVSALPRSGG